MPTETVLAPQQVRSAARWGLHALLVAGFASMIALTLIVAATALVHDVVTRDAVRQLVERDGRIADIALRSIGAMFKARRHEKDFLLTHEELGLDEAWTRYIGPFRMQLAELRADLSGIPHLTTTSELVEGVGRADAAVWGYEKDFLATVNLIDQVGHIDTGIEGEMRSPARALETRLVAERLDGLVVDLLQLRNHQMAYAQRGRERDAVSFRAALARMQSDLASARIAAPARIVASELATAYGDAFERYVTMSARIESSKADYQRALRVIEPMLEELYARASLQERASAARVGDANDLTIRVTSIASVIAVLLGIVIAVSISRNVGSAVAEAIRFASRVARGNLGIRLADTGNDAFGRLGGALNAMTTALEHSRNTLNDHAAELERRVDERTREFEQANEDLKRRNEEIRRYAAIVEGSGEAIISKDRDSNVVTWNRAAEQLFGYSQTEVLGRHLAFMVPPELRREESEMFGRIEAHEKVEHMETYRLHRDGRRIAVSLSVSPIFGADGKVLFTTASVRDVSERRRAEEALRSSEERFQLAARATNDAIWDLDVQTGSLWTSDAFGRHFGYRPDEYTPTVEFRIAAIHPDDRERVMSSGIAFLKGHEASWAGEYRFRCADGAYAFVSDRAFVRRNEAGRAVRLVGSMMNVTSQKQAEENLRDARDAAEAASRAKSEFVANMSHEIRTPMNGVLGTVSLLLSSDLNPTQRELAELARTSGENLLNIINDILDFSKIEAGKLTLESIPFDLLQVVEEAAGAMALRASEKSLDLIVRYPVEAPRYVTGDPARIRQVLTNLLGNAVKFTDRGQVLVNVEPTQWSNDRAAFRVSVADTGIGIAAQKRDLIFEKFTQADVSTTRRHGGTGLGLAISRDLVALMGGTIGVESEEGKGSTFWFVVSFALPEEMPRPMIPPADLRGVRVLVVDDNALHRSVLDEQVSGWKMRNGSSASGEEALRALREAAAAGDPYRIAIIDRHMPVIDGLMLGQAIKADPALRDTVLLTLTSAGAQGDVAQLTDAGFAAYLQKPVRQSELLSALQEVWTDHAHGRGSAIVSPHTLRASEMVQKNIAVERAHYDARVLLAEDNPTAQIVSAMMLRRLGCTVDVAANGREAADRLGDAPYDIVFMDCEMPLMDGFEATMTIRARRDDKARIPIVAVTAQAMQGDRERCLRAGMSDYLTKPVQEEAFSEALKRWVPATRSPSPGSGADAGKSMEEAAQAAAAGSEAALDQAVIEQLIDLASTDSSLLESIFKVFQDDALECLSALRRAADAGDAPALCRGAHSLKGASGVIGAIGMVRFARQLEDVAEGGVVEGATAIIGRMEAEFLRVKAAIAEVDRAPGQESRL